MNFFLLVLPLSPRAGYAHTAHEPPSSTSQQIHPSPPPFSFVRAMVPFTLFYAVRGLDPTFVAFVVTRMPLHPRSAARILHSSSLRCAGPILRFVAQGSAPFLSNYISLHQHCPDLFLLRGLAPSITTVAVRGSAPSISNTALRKLVLSTS